MFIVTLEGGVTIVCDELPSAAFFASVSDVDFIVYCSDL
jgi:hypothetical protein